MEIKVVPYRVGVMTIVVISLIASVVAMINPNGGPLAIPYITLFFPIFIIWLMAIMLILLDIPHRKRSITINENEIIGEKAFRTSSKELVYGGWIDSLTIKKSDIVNQGKDFQTVILNLAASHDNFVISTTEKNYVIDGRIFDCNVIALALDGKIQEAENLFEKKRKRKERFYGIFVAVMDVLLLVLAYYMSNI